MSNQWQPPFVAQGDVVLWHDGPAVTPHPYTALVTAVAKEGMVDVIVFPTSAHNGFPKSTCRHADDPNKQAINSSTDGVWTHTERNTPRAMQQIKQSK